MKQYSGVAHLRSGLARLYGSPYGGMTSKYAE